VWILGKREPSWKPGGRAARRGKRLAVGFRQWRRRDIARWPKTQETGSPHLQETFMHRVSAIVHCIAVLQYNHNRNRVSLYYLFQENKSFDTDCHLHSSSDVREVVSSTSTITVRQDHSGHHRRIYDIKGSMSADITVTKLPRTSRTSQSHHCQ
jgi:hypothetical protein